MTTAPHEVVPELTLGWRLKMALHHADISRDQMAEILGVTPSTLSRWMSDRGNTPPNRAYVAQWALATGVSQAWLERGEGGARPSPDGGETKSADTSALDALTRSKMDRARRRTSTAGYLAAPVVAA